MKIMRMYGTALKKLLIYPGDWHILKNYQEVLIKAYYHSGLKDIASHCGYKGRTLTSLEACSNFKRVHNFLVQVWEAMYRHIVTMQADDLYDLNDIIDMCSKSDDESIRSYVLPLVNEETYMRLVAGIEAKCLQDQVFQYWSRFVLRDCLAYVQLYVAIRSGNWSLRNSALKRMVVLFTAFDQHVYKVLIPHHLADVLERVPSHTSLWRHWLRSCWISMMWMYATSPSVYSCLPPPSESG